MLAGVPAASADHPKATDAESAYQLEAQTLGPDHAREHWLNWARERKALRAWRSKSPEERREIRKRDQQEAMATAQASAATAPPESEVGRWTTAPFRLPNYAIHSVLLPTGKVLFWSWPPPSSAPGGRANYGQAALWDPTQGTGPEAFKQVPPPVVDHDFDPATPPVQAPLFCSGQSLLPSGEVLVTGGNLVTPQAPGDSYNNFAGTRRVFTFNPWTETWTEQPSMAKGRWYPSQVPLADGRTVIVGGYTEDAPGFVQTSLVEQYTPAGTLGGQGAMALLTGADRKTNLYPRMNLMPTGEVLMTGPGKGQIVKLRSTTSGSGSWTGLGTAAQMSEHHFTGTAVPRSGEPDGSWHITSIGGSNGADAQGNSYGTTKVETFDFRTPAAGWALKPPLQVPRAHHNTVQLPDGSMVTVGGGLGNVKPNGQWAVDPAGPQRQIEIFDPTTEQWRLGPAQVEDRSYHSTALLLPDGRVWSAGDDVNPRVGGAISSFDTGEIYTPPALYNGDRPRIGRHPSALRWGDEFTVDADADAATPVKAVLVSPAAVTHDVDMGQRFVKLEVTQPYDGAASIKLKAPPTPQVAPPGYYMLFLVAENGSYSEAGWTRLTDVPGNEAPEAVATADPTSGSPPLTVDFDGTGSSDPDGDPLTYAWDLDADGQYDDSSSATPSFTYMTAGTRVVGLKVTDDEGLTATATVSIQVGGNTKPTATITSPTSDQTWRVGQQIDFAGSATDPEEGSLPASALDWSLELQHCPPNSPDCHGHNIQSFPDRASGSFAAPDHGYPSHLELTLTATDPGGLQDTKTVRLDPRTVNVTMALAQPWFAPLSLTLNSETAPAPFTRPVIEGSRNTISAPTPQVGAGGRTYDFTRWWYLGSTNNHTVTVNQSTTYTAAFAKRP